MRKITPFPWCDGEAEEAMPYKRSRHCGRVAFEVKSTASSSRW